MKKIPQQMLLVYQKIKDAEIKEGNLYMTETTFQQLHVCVNETLNYNWKKSLFKNMLRFDEENYNDMMARIVEDIRGEEIDQVIIVQDRVSKEGTPYQINKSITKK
jgi:hypothetical protein